MSIDQGVSAASGAAGALSGLAASGGSSSLTGSTSLGKDEFLKLLTAQLQHQDPLQPIQNEAFVAQLAQFSSLEQMQTMNGSLSTSILLNQSVNNSLATTLIGREVEAKGDGFTVSKAGDRSDLSFSLAGKAADVKVTVVDSSGKTVATLHPGQLDAGQQTATWNGKTDSGGDAPAGDYTFRVSATDTTGNPVAAETLVRGRVTGVKFENGATYLMVGARKLSLSDVDQIFEAGTQDSAP